MVKDVCRFCQGELKVDGWLGGIEYRGCVDCKADHTWNVNKPGGNPAHQIEEETQ